MLRFTFRTMAARKVRLVMSTLAIVLGVAFFAGVQTFSHGLSHTFDNIFKGSTASAVVQPVGTDNFAGTAATTLTLTPADVAKLAALPEVARADGSVGGIGMYLLDKDGKIVGATGAPTLAFNYTGNPNMLGEPMLTLRSGHWPRGPGQVMLDAKAAARAGYSVGDQVNVIAPMGSSLLQTFQLVGTTDFYGGGTAGAVLIVFDTPQAQQIFVRGRDVYNTVNLTAAHGVSQTELARAASTVLPAGFTAVTGDDVVKDSQDAIGSALGVISTFLLVFAIIAVVVGGFIVVNTFTILVAQRSRELALLRALGASRRQLTVSVLLEALVMSVIASTIGIVIGWGLALGLAATFRSFGLDIASSALTLTTRTVVLAYVVGVVATMVAAYLPARRAATVPPVAAMQEGRLPSAGSLRRRGLVGTAALVVGAAVSVWGVLGAPGNDAAWVGAGAGICILTVAVVSSVLGQPVLAACRAVFTWLFRAPGRLAGENARRDPRRTGATASALMIGLALVSLIGVLAASLNKSVDDLVDQQFSADFVVRNAASMPFPTEIGDALEKVPGVAYMARQQITAANYGSPDGDVVAVVGQDQNVPRIYHPDVISGRATLHGDEAYVSQEVATKRHLAVGDTMTLAFPGAREIHPTVVGIIDSNAALGPINVTLKELTAAGVQRQDGGLSLMLAPGAGAATVHAALDAVVAPLPIVTVQDKQEFSDSVRGQINQLLYLIYALLALAIVIAVIGIVNTLGLSVVERTRELGLLRAIGATRGQVRGMVTLESVAIAVLGAVLGMVLGVVFGALLRQVLSDDLTSLGVPIAQLVVFLVVSVVVGVLAAVVPAARASRLDVLRAIAVE